MKKIFYALITIFLMLGCSNSNLVSKQQDDMPKWYINTPKDSLIFIYGVGAGYNKDDAIKVALNNMISKLSVSIQSTYQMKKSSTSGSYNSYLKQTKLNIKSEVSKIRINNYEIEKSYKSSDGSIYLLVKANKIKLFNSLKKELDLKIKQFNQNKKTYKNNILKLYSIYKQALKDSKSLITKLLIMKELNDEFEDNKYFSKFLTISKEYENIKKNLTIYLPQSKIASPIRVALTDKFLSITKDKHKANLIVDIKEIVNKNKAMNAYVIKLSLDIKLKDKQGNIIGGDRISLKGLSFENYKQAYENGIKKLYNYIKINGLKKVLGFEF